MNGEAARLRTLLQRELQQAAAEALEADGAVSPDRLARLDRVARLVEIAESATPPAPRKRWPWAVALVATLLFVSVLLFARVRETEIELDLTTQDASFVMSTPQVLTEVMNLSALGASGLRKVDVPPAPGDPVTAPSAAASSVHITVTGDNGQRGALSLDAIALQAGTRVRIQNRPVPRQYRVSLEGNELGFRADLRGPVRIALGDRSPEQSLFGSPRPLLLESGPGLVDLDLTLEDGSPAQFVSQLEVSDLSLFRIDEYHSGERTMVRRPSTILSGTLYFEALDGRPYPLRHGEALHFNHSEGIIRSLDVQKGQMILRFRGRVRGMRTGWAGAERSLMPTLLDWLKARHGLYLLWGTTLYIVGLIAGILRWWGYAYE